MALVLLLVPAQATRAQSAFNEGGGSFEAPVDYGVGALPYSATFADLNGDGLLDLATGNHDGDSISVRLGVAGGTFASPATFAAGDGTEGIVAADVNADGKVDIAAANISSSTVSVLLGNGAGGFAAAQSHAVGINPHAVVAADFTNDGKVDLATADGSQGTLSILVGNGAGGFAPSVQVPLGCSNPRDLVSADFNGDGKRDAAITCQGGSNIAVVLGNGSGGFGAPVSIPVGAQPFGIAVGQFDAGSVPDLAVANFGSGSVTILLGNGTGGFSAAPGVLDAPLPYGLRAQDMDGDGKQDLVVASGNDLAMLFMGNGAGAFSASTSFSASSGVVAVVPRDLDADGRIDLAVVNQSSASVSILRSNGIGPLSIAPSATVEAGSSYAARKAGIWINRQTSGIYPAGFPFSHAGYADLDRDGDTDFVRTFSDNDHRFPVQVMINDGSGGFTDQTATRIVGAQPGTVTPRKVLAGDYNGDGWPDVLVLGHGVDAPPFPGEYPQLFLSTGNGKLAYAPHLESLVGFHHGGTSADIDGNGTIDVFTNATEPAFLLNDGTGHFTWNTARVPRVPGSKAFHPIASELVDVDGDGYIDLVADGYEPNGLSNAVYWGSSSGVYRFANRSVLPAVADMGVTLDFAIEDIDHDGRRDVIVLRTGSTHLYEGRYLQVVRQTGARTFVDETAARIAFDGAKLPIDYLRAQDFNGDGFVDLFVDDKNDVASGQYAWLNNGQGVFAPYSGPVNLPDGTQVSVGDAATVEGDAGSKPLVFTISLSRPSIRPVSVDVYTDPGTASPGVDYASNAAIGVTIPAGQTSTTFPVAVLGDTQVEGHETFTVNLANALDARLGDGQALGRITNDDMAQLSIDDAGITEGNTGIRTLSFLVRLSHPMPNPVTYDIATSNGSASAGSDYVARSQAGRYLDAGRTQQLFEVAILGDAQVEPNETFQVTIANVQGAVLSDGSATGTIGDDDGAAARARARAAARTVNRTGTRSTP